MYIWAQPETGKTLRNFSLNLVTTDLASVVSFPAGLSSNVVYNGLEHQTTQRFERTYDAHPDGLAAAIGDDGLLGVRSLQGFTFSTGIGTYTGIGGAVCAGGDQYCAVATNGNPAWLLGAVTTRPIVNSGSAEYFLQVGVNGMNYAGQPTSQTTAVFGTDPDAAGTNYNAQSDREITKLLDTADLTIQACASDAGDHNGNCKVDAADYVAWRNNMGGFGGPGGYTIWRSNFGDVSPMGVGTGATVASAIPEPTAAGLALLGYSSIAASRRWTRRRSSNDDCRLFREVHSRVSV
jgi:hypothetical protein